MAGANLPVTLLVLGGGIVMVWIGISDPEDGIIKEVGRVLNGKPRPDALKRKGTSGADLASAILAFERPTTGGGGGDGLAQVGHSGGGNGVIGVARAQIGYPYVWGGGNSNGPTKGINGGNVLGFDCSGLLQFAHKKGAGIDIPRLAETQRATSKRISESDAQPGDSVFFGMPAYHCGIYIGGGQMIHAPYPGTKVRTEAVKNVNPGPITYGRFTAPTKTASV